MRFNSSLIYGLFSNEKDCVGEAIRAIHHTERIVVAQGFGVKDSGIPLRFLAYTVPVFHLMKQLPATATTEFYVALHGCLRANRLNEATTRENGAAMAQLVREYAARRHPELLPRVRVLHDTEVPPGSALDGFIISLLTDEVKQRCMADEQIRRFVEKRGGDDALRYMVEHAVYMRDPLAHNADPIRLLVPDMATDTSHVIMVGGPPEKIFHKVRRVLCGHFGIHSKWQSHQFFTKIGDPPTYHLQPGEPLWEDRQSLPEDAHAALSSATHPVSADHGIRTTVMRDLLALLGDAGECANFAELFSCGPAILQGRPLPPPLATCLQHGWEHIRKM